VDCGKACIATGGAKNVGDGGQVRTEVFQAAEDVVADSSVVV
jgi:hypothetical protein